MPTRGVSAVPLAEVAFFQRSAEESEIATSLKEVLTRSHWRGPHWREQCPHGCESRPLRSLSRAWTLNKIAMARLTSSRPEVMLVGRVSGRSAKRAKVLSARSSSHCGRRSSRGGPLYDSAPSLVARASVKTSPVGTVAKQKHNPACPAFAAHVQCGCDLKQ